MLDHTCAAFTPELIRARHNVGNLSPVPVFIVGMARSGSTLVEQILASHPQVFGGGELMSFSNTVQGIQAKFGGSAPFPECVSDMTDEAYRDLGTRYLSLNSSRSPPAPLT